MAWIYRIAYIVLFLLLQRRLERTLRPGLVRTLALFGLSRFGRPLPLRRG